MFVRVRATSVTSTYMSRSELTSQLPGAAVLFRWLCGVVPSLARRLDPFPPALSWQAPLSPWHLLLSSAGYLLTPFHTCCCLSVLPALHLTDRTTVLSKGFRRRQGQMHMCPSVQTLPPQCLTISPATHTPGRCARLPGAPTAAPALGWGEWRGFSMGPAQESTLPTSGCCAGCWSGCLVAAGCLLVAVVALGGMVPAGAVPCPLGTLGESRWRR